MTDKVWLFRPEYLTYIFSKIKEVRVTSMKKKMTLFVANAKIFNFLLSKIYIFENLHLPP